MFLFELTCFIFELPYKYVPCFVLLNLSPSIFISAAMNIVYFPMFKPGFPSVKLNYSVYDEYKNQKRQILVSKH